MGYEASKTKSLWGDFELSLLEGNGIDIGAGPDPIAPSALSFDLSQGDANKVDEYFDHQFDYVFSSHCLEHMYDPKDAIKRWWSLVKPGGHMIILVPDEDLYEQGYWPSIFNDDHKFTFTLKHSRSWSPVSLNLSNLAASLEGGEILKLAVQDHGYDHDLKREPMDRRSVMAKRKLLKRLAKFARVFRLNFVHTLTHTWGLPVDQTARGALAQIQLIMKKKQSYCDA